ncbi:MAG: glycosyltransferase [Deltaproteobacteria bacterium]|nr:glycosyltransferase [Deltaproteobacteria bacterium]
MAQPLYIFHVITGTMVGGAENHLVTLVRGSDPNRLRHFVVGLGPEGPMAGRMRDGGAQVVSLGLAPGPGALVKGLPALVRLLRRQRPQLIQTWMYHADLLGLLAGELLRLPVVWSLQCSDLEAINLKPLTRRIITAAALLSRRPRAILANSQAGLEHHAARGYHRPRLQVVRNGFDTTVFRPDEAARQAVRAELGLGPADVLVLCVARYDPVKNHAGLLEAWAQIAPQHPRAHLLLIGREITPDNPALAAALAPPLAGRVRLAGERSDIPRWLAAGDLHVSASFSEGLSNTVGEAMAAGLPNLVTDAGDSAVLVGDTGRVVPPGDPAALAGDLGELLTLDPAARRALGQAARQRIQDEFSLAAMMDAFEEVYRRHARP